MQDDTAAPVKRGMNTGVKIALIGAGVVAGAIGATAIGANATTAGTGTAAVAAYNSVTAASGTTSDAPGDHDGHGRGGPGGQNPDETVVTDATTKDKLTAAAKAAVPGATVDKVESDSGDAKYEVHMTKSDGTRVSVKFDANLKQTAVEDGMGK